MSRERPKIFLQFVPLVNIFAYQKKKMQEDFMSPSESMPSKTLGINENIR
jgi:hypothetical protein